MAGFDGIALAGTVRSFWPKLAIVLLADRVLPNDTDLPSVTVVLVRPFSPQQLVEAIREAIAAQSYDEQLTSSGVEQQIHVAQLAH